MGEELEPSGEAADERHRKDRADRREEIKLRLEYAKSAVALAGLAGIAVAVLQWQMSNVAARDNASTARQTAYARIAKEWRDHVRLLIDKPELRPYFADGKSLEADDANRNVVIAMADHRLEVMDSILTYAGIAGASSEIGGWIRTFQHAFRSSPALCRRAVEVQRNYGDELQRVMQICGR